jgi:hypothetical protein
VGTLAPIHAGVIGVHQSVSTDLGRLPGYCALLAALVADLKDFRSPQRSRAAMQGLPLRAKHIAAGAVKCPEGVRAAVHGAVCGGGRGEVCGDTVGGAGVGQAQTAVTSVNLSVQYSRISF